MKRFRLVITLRVSGLAATLAAAVYLLTNSDSLVAAGILALLAFVQVRGLIDYVDKTNRDLTRFLRSIRYSDFSQTFTGERRGGTYTELGEAFRDVMAEFRTARAEKEEHYRYLHTVIQHIGVGLISFRQDGSVELINNAAKRLLRVRRLKNVYDLERQSKDLVTTLVRLHAGQRELVKIVDNDELLQLAISATEFKMRGELFKLVSIQNIQSELEEKEIEAWQKLTRVLTHEIMNSITPISSLASTANDLLIELDLPENGETREEVIGDVRDAVRTIEKRSRSLLNFVDAYRSVTRIPQPDFQIVSVSDLFQSITDLMHKQMTERGAAFKCSVEPETLTITADSELVEQVLINLLKNAMEAVAGREGAVVKLHAGLDSRGRSFIQVVDNGSGIVPEALDKIFIPFFTTKKEGSGIGLSLSREIMRRHGGTIAAVSEPGERTVFTLRF